MSKCAKRKCETDYALRVTSIHPLLAQINTPRKLYRSKLRTQWIYRNWKMSKTLAEIIGFDFENCFCFDLLLLVKHKVYIPALVWLYAKQWEYSLSFVGADWLSLLKESNKIPKKLDLENLYGKLQGKIDAINERKKYNKEMKTQLQHQNGKDDSEIFFYCVGFISPSTVAVFAVVKCVYHNKLISV